MTPIKWSLSPDGDDAVSLNYEKTIGFREDSWKNSQTRYVRIHTERLKEWAEKVDSSTEDRAVWVGVTPTCPLSAKLSKDSDMTLCVAPFYDSGQLEGEE